MIQFHVCHQPTCGLDSVSLQCSVRAWFLCLLKPCIGGWPHAPKKVKLEQKPSRCCTPTQLKGSVVAKCCYTSREPQEINSMMPTSNSPAPHPTRLPRGIPPWPAATWVCFNINRLKSFQGIWHFHGCCFHHKLTQTAQLPPLKHLEFATTSQHVVSTKACGILDN